MKVNEKTGLVPVLFLKPATPYQVGNVAGFPPVQAKKLTSGDNPTATLDLDHTVEATASDDGSAALKEAAQAVSTAEGNVADRDTTIAELKKQLKDAPKAPTATEAKKATEADKAKDVEIAELKKQLEELTKPDNEGVKENAGGAGGGAK